MKQVLASVLMGVLTLALAASSALAQPARLTRVSDAPFPSRTFVLTLGSRQAISPGDIRLTENGRRVAALSVTAASTASGADLGVVLVIDASRSMSGRPIAGAMAAARAFARHRNANQELAVVSFNHAATTRLAFTSDPQRIGAALAQPPALGRETHIYDAVGAGLRLLHAAHIKTGSIVLLSDGGDTGSRLAEARALAQATAAGVRVFTVGLRSGAFDPQTLRSLASGTQATYSEAASPRDLARIYDQLGTELSSEYLIRYRSLAGQHDRVHVQASIPTLGLSADSSYRTPALPAHLVPPFHTSFWRSNEAVAIVCAVCVLLIALTVLILIRMRPARRPLRDRLSDFVSSAAKKDGDREDKPLSRVLSHADRGLKRREWWGRFVEDLDVASIATPPVRLVAATAAGTLVAILLLLVMSGSALLAVLGLAVPIAVHAAIRRKVEVQRRLFSEQLADTLEVIASAMRAGQSFVGAMAVALDEAPEPTRGEFRRAVEDERLGVPIEAAIGSVVTRMRNTDLEQVQLVASLQRETGGNTAEVLDHVATTVRERMELRRTIKTLTAQGRLSRWILTGLPPALLASISVLNPGYMSTMVHTSTGRFLLVVAALMVLGGSLAIRRIVEMEV